jgi:hypothetical protein
MNVQKYPGKTMFPPLDQVRGEPGEHFEYAISQQNAERIEDHIIDIDRTVGVAQQQRDQKLQAFDPKTEYRYEPDQISGSD